VAALGEIIEKLLADLGPCHRSFYYDRGPLRHELVVS
jgi:hypothetical protein